MRSVFRSPLSRISVLFLGLVAACTSSGDISNPLERRLVWFSHISGEDIQLACSPGVPDRYRLTYNANRARQVRVYDIGLPASEGVAQAPGAVSASIDVLDGPVDFGRLPIIDDVFRPWRPKRETFVLDTGAVDQVRFDLIEAGLKKAVPEGRRLASPSYFWLAAACIDGEFSFQVWEHPDVEFNALSFPSILFARDGSSVAPLQPPSDDKRIVNYVSPVQQQEIHRDTYDHYDLIVAADGVEPGTIYARR